MDLPMKTAENAAPTQLPLIGGSAQTHRRRSISNGEASSNTQKSASAGSRETFLTSLPQLGAPPRNPSEAALQPIYDLFDEKDEAKCIKVFYRTQFAMKEEAMQEAKAEVEVLTKKLKILETELAKTYREQEELREKLVLEKTANEALTKQILQLELTIEKLQHGTGLGDVSHVKTQLAGAKQEKEKLQEQLQELEHKLSMLEDSGNAVTKQKEEYLRKYKECEKNLKEATAEKQQLQQKLKVLSQQLQQANTVSALVMVKSSQEVSALIARQAELEAQITKAKEVTLAYESNAADLFRTLKAQKEMNLISTKTFSGKDDVPPPVGEVVIMFTDIQSSTALWERDSTTFLAALTQHNNLIRGLLHKYGGYEVKTEGDSFMLAFGSAERAVSFALSLQEQLLQVDWPAALLAMPHADEERSLADGRLLFRGLRVRAGMHIGRPTCREDPVTRRMDYFGPVVNRAARVGAAGHGGQTLLSTAVWEALPRLAGYEQLMAQLVARDLGRFQLRGLAAPEGLIQVLPVALSHRMFPPPAVNSRDALEEQLAMFRRENESLTAQLQHLVVQLRETNAMAIAFASQIKDGSLARQVSAEELRLREEAEREQADKERQMKDELARALEEKAALAAAVAALREELQQHRLQQESIEMSRRQLKAALEALREEQRSQVELLDHDKQRLAKLLEEKEVQLALASEEKEKLSQRLSSADPPRPLALLPQVLPLAQEKLPPAQEKLQTVHNMEAILAKQEVLEATLSQVYTRNQSLEEHVQQLSDQITRMRNEKVSPRASSGGPNSEQTMRNLAAKVNKLRKRNDELQKQLAQLEHHIIDVKALTNSFSMALRTKQAGTAGDTESQLTMAFEEIDGILRRHVELKVKLERANQDNEALTKHIKALTAQFTNDLKERDEAITALRQELEEQRRATKLTEEKLELLESQKNAILGKLNQPNAKSFVLAGKALR